MTALQLGAVAVLIADALVAWWLIAPLDHFAAVIVSGSLALLAITAIGRWTNVRKS